MGLSRAGQGRPGKTRLPSRRAADWSSRANGYLPRIWWRFYQQPGQGAIGLEIRANDLELHRYLGEINDAPTWFCTAVEREFLRLLGGGCSLPVGIRTSLEGGELRCEAIIFDESDKPRSGTLSGRIQTCPRRPLPHF